MDSRLRERVFELEDAVKFHDNLTADELNAMEYETLLFRGGYILKERARIKDENLLAVTFNAWQIMRLHVSKPPSWDKYRKSHGLGPRESIQDLKNEAEQAMKNVELIMKKAKKHGRR